MLVAATSSVLPTLSTNYQISSCLFRNVGGRIYMYSLPKRQQRKTPAQAKFNEGLIFINLLHAGIKDNLFIIFQPHPPEPRVYVTPFGMRMRMCKKGKAEAKHYNLILGRNLGSTFFVRFTVRRRFFHTARDSSFLTVSFHSPRSHGAKVHPEGVRPFNR